MNTLAIFCLLSISVAFTNAKIHDNCKITNTKTPVQVFETDKLLGKWYAMELFSVFSLDGFSSPPVKCFEETYNRTSNPKELDVTTISVSLETNTREIEASKVVIDSEAPLKTVWKLSSEEDGQMEELDMLWVSTDYDNLALAWICTETHIKDFRLEMLTLLSRSRTVDQNALDMLPGGKDLSLYPSENRAKIDQTGCLDDQ